jgi:hypothetical protein
MQVISQRGTLWIIQLLRLLNQQGWNGHVAQRGETRNKGKAIPVTDWGVP